MKKFVNWFKKNSGVALGSALLLKMLLFRLMVVKDLTLLGILSDFGVILTLMALPAILFKNVWKSVFQYAFAFVLSLVWFATSIYYNYYGNIPTYQTLANLNQVGQISESVTASMDWYMPLFFIDFVVFVVSALIWKNDKHPRIAYWMGTRKQRSPRIIAACLFGIGVVICAGSLWGASTIENDHALSKRLGVINYQLAVMKEKPASASTELSEEQRAEINKELDQWLAENEQPEHALYHGIGADRNLIVIQLESFQNFVVGLEVNGQEITPYLNQLIKEHFYFPNVYQQIGEGNTSDAEFILNTSIYPIGTPAMSHYVTGKEVPSLPRTLNSKGYKSYTFHVNDVTFWNRNEMYPALGFTDYFEKQNFENDQFNSFGASDEELYRVALNEFSQWEDQKQPFYAHVLTVSSHHPFVIPEQYQTLELPASITGTQLGHYLQASYYTDKQLGIFIEGLKEKGIWDESVIAIYGDHFGLQQKENDPKWVSEQLGVPYHETISRMNIPLIIAVPGVAGETIEQVGGQVDILPTLLNILGISSTEHDMMLFGNDLLNTENNIVGSRYYLPSGSFFNNEVLYIPGASFEAGKAYDIKTFAEVDDLESLRPDYDYILQLEKMSDLYSLQLPKRASK